MKKIYFLFIVIVLFMLGVYGYSLKNKEDLELTVQSSIDKITANKIYNENRQNLNREFDEDLEVLNVDSNNTSLKVLFTQKSWITQNSSLLWIVQKDGEVVNPEINNALFTELILPSEPGLYTFNFQLTNIETGEVFIFGFEALVE